MAPFHSHTTLYARSSANAQLLVLVYLLLSSPQTKNTKQMLVCRRVSQLAIACYFYLFHHLCSLAETGMCTWQRLMAHTWRRLWMSCFQSPLALTTCLWRKFKKKQPCNRLSKTNKLILWTALPGTVCSGDDVHLCRLKAVVIIEHKYLIKVNAS